MLVSTKELKSIIEKSKLFVNSKSSDPTLASIAFTLQKDGILGLYSTDLESGLYTEIPCQGNSIDKGFSINSKVLDSILKTKSSDMNFELDKETNCLQVNNSKVFSLPLKEFPAKPYIESDITKEIYLNRADFLSMLEKTCFSIAKNGQRHTLNGLYIQFQDGKISFTSSDGHRLSHYDLPFTTDYRANLVIPKDTIIRLIKILKKSKSMEMLFQIREQLVEVTKLNKETGKSYQDMEIKSYHLFIIDGMEIYTRLITGEYPNFGSILDTDNADAAYRIKDGCNVKTKEAGKFNHILINKESLITAIEAVKPFCGEKTQYAKFTFSHGNLTLYGNDPNKGEAKETIEIISDLKEDENYSMGMNLRYVLEAINSIDNDDLDIRVYSHDNPFIFIQNMGLSLVMPMRLQ